MSGTDGDPFAAGAAEATRLAREVQDLGFSAARTIVERFVEMCGQFTTAKGDNGAAQQDGRTMPPFWFGGSDESMRRWQSDMARATDAYVAVLNQFNEASLRFFDTTRWWRPPSAEGTDLVLPEVAPGGRASARLWLHNTTASAAVDLRPWCPGLATHAGVALAVGSVTCQPERIDRLEPNASRELVVTVAVEEGASPGVFHGQLLVDGLPDVVFPLRVRVRAAPDA